MKRLSTLILVLLVLLFSACSVQTRQDLVLASVGNYETRQFWSHGGFQDYTDFGIYTYSSADLEGNRYFSAVTVENMQTIGAFVDDFEGWVDGFRQNDPEGELALNYAFDRSIIDSGDYFYIYEKENYPAFGCYDLWFFDSQTNVLYYFHNNI